MVSSPVTVCISDSSIFTANIKLWETLTQLLPPPHAPVWGFRTRWDWMNAIHQSNLTSAECLWGTGKEVSPLTSLEALGPVSSIAFDRSTETHHNLSSWERGQKNISANQEYVTPSLVFWSLFCLLDRSQGYWEEGTSIDERFPPDWPEGKPVGVVWTYSWCGRAAYCGGATPSLLPWAIKKGRWASQKTAPLHAFTSVPTSEFLPWVSALWRGLDAASRILARILNTGLGQRRRLGYNIYTGLGLGSRWRNGLIPFILVTLINP